jgi:hypothetical protein
MLSAGAIVCIISIVKKWDVLKSLELLLGVLLLFYFLGTIARDVVKHTLEKDGIPPEEYEEEEETTEENPEVSETAKEEAENPEAQAGAETPEG